MAPIEIIIKNQPTRVVGDGDLLQFSVGSKWEHGNPRFTAWCDKDGTRGYVKRYREEVEVDLNRSTASKIFYQGLEEPVEVNLKLL